MTKINLTYCGMAGSGDTVKAAKQDAASKIESLLDDMRPPVLVKWRDDAMLVYRTASGWDYQCLHGMDKESMVTRQYGSTVCCSGTYEDTLRSAIQHLADNVRREGENEIPSVITESGLRPRIIAEMSAEYLRRGKQDDINAQRGREADAMGLTGIDRYAYITQDPRRGYASAA